jgi:polysaccharide export outer membrane protein
MWRSAAGQGGSLSDFTFFVYGREKMKKILLSVSLILAFAGMGVAQQKPPAKGGAAKPAPAEPQQKIATPQVAEDFVIGVEDVLAVSIWKDADTSVPNVVVRPDGKITLPLIGDVLASGLTTKQLADSITEKIKKFLDEPTVAVIVVRIESQKVSIVGAIGHPGSYPLGAPMTVLELIARAGGLADFAKTKSIRIVRKKGGRIFMFNYKEVISGIHLEQNIYLENGDIVMVAS